MIDKLTKKVLNEEDISEEEFHILITADLDKVTQSADKIRNHFMAGKGELCSILNAKQGGCGEDCKFCAQSRSCSEKIDIYPFTDKETAISRCKAAAENNLSHFSMVTAGRNLSQSDLEKAVDIYKELSKLPIKICASHGLLSYEDFVKLKEAGVERIHSNIETSKNFFPNICSSHSFDDKIKCIKAAQKAGFEICSGGILGVGEDFFDRISMAYTLRQLNVISIPLNILIPKKGTEFENIAPMSKEDILRSVSIFRFINPKAYIRMAAGRRFIGDSCFSSGSNASITGDFLTTTGTTVKSDIELFKKLNYTY